MVAKRLSTYRSELFDKIIKEKIMFIKPITTFDDKTNKYLNEQMCEKYIHQIKVIICSYFFVSIDEVYAVDRHKKFVLCRQLIAFFIHKIINQRHTFLSLNKIGSFNGGVKHDNIIYSLKTINNYINTDIKFYEQVIDILNALASDEEFKSLVNINTQISIRDISILNHIENSEIHKSLVNLNNEFKRNTEKICDLYKEINNLMIQNETIQKEIQTIIK